MDERDKEIQDLRRENDRLRRELKEARAMQRRLFRLVPADKILEAFRETPENKTNDR